jgi:hypothetical protein
MSLQKQKQLLPVDGAVKLGKERKLMAENTPPENSASFNNSF